MKSAVEESTVARLRAAGCVFAEDEAGLLIEAATAAAAVLRAEAGPEQGAEAGAEAGGESGAEAGAEAGTRVGALAEMGSESAVAALLEPLVARRVAGEPLEYILGWAEFAGLRIRVEAPVFVPRRRTQLLADEAVVRAQAWPDPVVVELCCGAAAIAAVVAERVVRGLDLYAADIDPAAVRSARVNVGDRATVLEGDLYDALPAALRGRIAVLAANAPYVPTAAIRTMPPEARLFEAPVALDGGGDGLDVHRRLAEHAAAWLRPGGCLIVEVSERQAPVTAGLFEQWGMAASIRSSADLDATIVIGTRA